MAVYFLLGTYTIIPFPHNLAGVILMYLGLNLNKNARDLFAKHQTSHRYEDSTTLIRDGTFARTRNPVYLGMVIFILGFAVCFGNLLSMIVPIIFMQVIHFIFIPYEEKKMERIFGSDFMNYRKHVKRWF
jgi:protein-S-isoprenylcysteine O-methyltransferase Ste14